MTTVRRVYQNEQACNLCIRCRRVPPQICAECMGVYGICSGWLAPEELCPCPNHISPATEACIHCRRAFADAYAVRHYFGGPDDRVGPFCGQCDRTIKAHTGFTSED